MKYIIIISTLILVSCVDNDKETKSSFKFIPIKNNYDKKDNHKTNYLEKEDSLNLVNS